MEHVALTLHARHRRTERGIPENAVAAALDFGSHVHRRGADHYTIGWREVADAKKHGVDISAFDGVTVVCTADDRVLTTYRKRRPASLGRRAARGRHVA